MYFDFINVSNVLALEKTQLEILTNSYFEQDTYIVTIILGGQKRTYNQVISMLTFGKFTTRKKK